MTEEQKQTVKEFTDQLKEYNFDGDEVAVNINLLLELVTEELGGNLSYWTCSTKNTEHKKIVIEYDYVKQNRQNS